MILILVILWSLPKVPHGSFGRLHPSDHASDQEISIHFIQRSRFPPYVFKPLRAFLNGHDFIYFPRISGRTGIFRGQYI